jgi:adenylosuccinate synthase
VTKAYTSRVGEGPFPAELKDSLGERLQNKGEEFGTVTKRPRRCGWLDLVMVNYANRINGVSDTALTKIDVLSGFDEINVCVAYNYNGNELKAFPANMRILAECRPVYETLKGWGEPSRQDWLSFAEKGYEALPRNLRSYIDYFEDSTGIPVRLISFGPERAWTIERSIK